MLMRAFVPALRAIGLAAMLSGMCVGPVRAQSSARFDWFTYEGRDPVYARIKADERTYLNPILPGFYPDPSLTRAGDDYYLVTSSFAYFPGVPIFHSRDLVTWTQIGSVLNRPSQLNLDAQGISRGVFAPMIAFHQGTFYLITTIVGSGGNVIVTAKDPAGPWSDPVRLELDGIDPSLFFDDDGRVYVVNNGPPIGEPLYEGHRALWMQEYDPAARKLIGSRKMAVNGGVDLSKKPIWIEAPHVLKVKGRYYLIAAEGGTAEQHSEVVFRSASVWGPWEPYKGNPILTQRHLDPDRAFPITSTGHASFVQTPNGEWWAVFLGTRPYKENFYNTGRETFMLPVEWRDGWPHILRGKATVSYRHRRPALPAAPRATAMKQGNFVETDDFSGATLAPYWAFIRTVRDNWYNLSSHPGWLTIEARPQHIGKVAQPSFIGRRQQHAHATVTAAMRYKPAKAGDKAGVVAFQNDDYYYLLAVTLAAGKRVIRLEKSGGAKSNGATEVLASMPLAGTGDDTLYLRVEARGETYDFGYALAPGKWQPVKTAVDATHLSTKVAGGFVGAMFGMYAYTEPTVQNTALSEMEVVQRQMDAYNRHDIDAYAALYAPDARVYNFPGQLLLNGRDAIHKAFGTSFARSPGANVVALNRMEYGRYVLIHGRVTGIGPEPTIGVAIYEVSNGLIQNAWLMQAGAGQ